MWVPSPDEIKAALETAAAVGALSGLSGIDLVRWLRKRRARRKQSARPERPDAPAQPSLLDTSTRAERIERSLGGISFEQVNANLVRCCLSLAGQQLNRDELLAMKLSMEKQRTSVLEDTRMNDRLKVLTLSLDIATEMDHRGLDGEGMLGIAADMIRRAIRKQV